MQSKAAQRGKPPALADHVLLDAESMLCLMAEMPPPCDSQVAPRGGSSMDTCGVF